MRGVVDTSCKPLPKGVSLSLERGGEIPGSGLIVFACPAPPSHKGALSPHRWQARWGKRTCEQRLAGVEGRWRCLCPRLWRWFSSLAPPPSEKGALPHRWQARRGERTYLSPSSSRRAPPPFNPKPEIRNLKSNLFLVRDLAVAHNPLILTVSTSLAQNPLIPTLPTSLAHNPLIPTLSTSLADNLLIPLSPPRSCSFFSNPYPLHLA